jgi:WD40 repeat protein
MFRRNMAAPKKPDLPATRTQTGLIVEASYPAALGRATASLKERDHKRYEIIGEHARGGLGRVMRTRDIELGREVAVKEILEPGGLGEARFVREALLTARLEHPSIVPVYDAGRWPDGTPFYSMKLVSGRAFKDRIQEATTLDSRLALLPHVIAVADAIAYAHDRKIIHRDLKPSNIIIGEFGETVVIDWGLAKDLRVNEPDLPDGGPYRTQAAGDGFLTSTGAVLGTPAYMPPEQARGEEVDERADVYAIGAILYHLLAGQSPFDGTNSPHVLRAVLRGNPPSLRSVLKNASLRVSELIAIAEKAMDRSVDRRYRNARPLADDLKRLQAGLLVGAHRYGAVGLVRKWVARHRALVGASLATMLIVAITGALSIRAVYRERDAAVLARKDAEARRVDAEAARSLAKQKADETILSEAVRNLSIDHTRALKLVAQLSDDGFARPETRDVLLRMAGAGLPFFATRLPTPGERVRFEKDGQHVLVAGAGYIRRYTVEGGTLAQQIESSPVRDSVTSSLVCGASNVCARTQSSGQLTIVRAGKLLFDQLVAPDGINDAAFDEDGRHLAVACVSGEVILLDIESLTYRAVYRHVGPAVEVAFLGSEVVSAGADGFLRRAQAGMVRSLRASKAPLQSIHTSQDGKLIAAGDEDGHVIIADAGTLRTLRTFDVGLGRVLRVRFVDGKVLAATSAPRTILLDLNGNTRREFAGGPDFEVGSDGRVAMFTGRGELLEADLAQEWESARPGHGVSGFYLDVFEGTIATVAADQTLRLWSTSPKPLLTRNSTARKEGSLYRLERGPLGTLLLGYEDGSASVMSWDGRDVLTVPGIGDMAVQKAAKDSETIAIAGEFGSKVLIQDEGHIYRFDAGGPTMDIALSSDGATVVFGVATARGKVLRWTRQRPDRLEQLLETSAPVHSVDLENDGQTAMIGTDSGEFLRINLGDGTLASAFLGSKITDIDVMADDSAYASTLAGRMYVWKSGSPQPQLLGECGAFTGRVSAGSKDLALSPCRDGSVLSSQGTKVMESAAEALSDVVLTTSGAIVAGGVFGHLFWTTDAGVTVHVMGGVDATFRLWPHPENGSTVGTFSRAKGTVQIWKLSGLGLPRSSAELKKWILAKDAALAI